MMHRAMPLVAAMLIALSGCATQPPFQGTEARRGLAPRQVVEDPERYLGQRVLWGGVIVDSENLAGKSRLEVLAYPIDTAQRPEVDASARGRFLVEQAGYLETADFAPGRSITVLGAIRETRTGQVGKASYRYPLVRPDGLHLWPREAGYMSPRFHFGVGVGIGVGD